MSYCEKGKSSAVDCTYISHSDIGRSTGGFSKFNNYICLFELEIDDVTENFKSRHRFFFQ
jgi:hypothetical protein